MNRSRFALIGSLALLLALFTSGQAQTITATLEGRVTDTSGAVIAGAKISAVNTRTGLSRSADSSETGEYRIPLLPPGEYTVTVERQGFSKESRKITLEIGQSGSADFTLQAGGVAEKVEVVATDTVAEPTRTEVSSVINQQQIETLPVNGRQFIDFALLAPAVRIGDSTSGSTDVIIEPVTKLSFAGQNIHFNFVAIDGADNISTASGVQKTTPSQEAVQEFRVINSTYSAEYGRAVAGIVNIITRSGSNSFHGSLYDFFRDDSLDATSILASPGLDKLRQNQFGGTLGGPIKKEKAFFFTNYEGQRREESPFYNSTVLANIDLINLAKARFGLAPENLNVRRDSDYDNFLVKLDHNVSQRHTLLGHYFFNDGRLRNVSPLNDGFDLPSGFKDNFLRDQSVVGNLISTFSQSWVNELRGQYAHRSFDFPTVTAQPHLEVANTFAVGVNRGNPDVYKESRFELVDNATFTRGNHVIGFGGNYNFVRTTESFPLFFPFEATFGSINDFVSGTPFVIFFQKFPDFTQTGFDTSIFKASRYPDVVRETAKGQLDHTYNAVYLQDKWRVTDKLALSLGVRYEWETFPSRVLDNDLNNVDPRFGFAYNVGGKWNFVVRGGAGLFHGIIPNPLLMCQEAVCGGSGPFPGREQKEDALNARTRAFAFASIPPRMQQALSDILATGQYPQTATPFDFLAESVIARFARNHQAPYGIQISLGFEFEPTRGTAVSASYLRVRGVHLGSFFNVNQPDPSGKLVSGKDDFAAVRFDRFNSVPGVRNPNFAVYFEADSRWNSVWDGLLLNVNRRFSNHFSYGVSYTLSKGIDDGPNPSFVLIPENSKRIDLEKALSADDARHRLVANATVAGPTTGNILLRDFQFGVIVSVESPHHFTKFAGFDANGDVFGVNDRVGLESRNTFKGDNYRSVDVRLSRTLRSSESSKIELIGEAFNLFNTLNIRFFNTVYGDSIFNPSGTPGTFFEGALNPAYGTPRAIFNPRQLQLAFRFTF
jgi:carboxypeptidase family protein/TonB-dependent receptor-like protein